MANRNLLHENKLEVFKEWVQTQGYIVHPNPNPEKNIYEVLRIEKYVREGNNEHIVLYRTLKSVHITLPKHPDIVPLVLKFLDETRTGKQKSQARKKKARKMRRILAGESAEKIGGMGPNEMRTYHKVQKNKEEIYNAKRKPGKPSSADVSQALEDADEMGLPDGAYWAMVHDLLGLEYGDVFDLLVEYGFTKETSDA